MPSLLEILSQMGSEASGMAPSARLMQQIMGQANPKAGFGMNMDTANWAADIINNLVGTAGAGMSGAAMAPKVGGMLSKAIQASPKANAYLPKAMANQTGLYRFAKPEEIKEGSNAFSARWDKKPRVEISDDAMRLKTLSEKNLGNTDYQNLKHTLSSSTELGNLIDHPELFAQHPESKTIFTKLRPLEEGGYFDSAGITTGITKTGNRATVDPKTLTHELQHALQEHGGMAKGGSPELFNTEIAVRNRIVQDLPDINGAILLKEKGVKKFLEEWGESKKAREWAKNYSLEKLKILQRNALELQKTPNTTDALYKTLAGEFEARDAASRMNLTPEQRITTPPYSSENIPLEDLIVRGNK